MPRGAFYAVRVCPQKEIAITAAGGSGKNARHQVGSNQIVIHPDPALPRGPADTRAITENAVGAGQDSMIVGNVLRPGSGCGH